MLIEEQYLISNYVKEPWKQKQYGTGVKTDMKTNGIE
jgi:hypothetical protein